VARFLDDIKRTHRCGALRESDIGKTVVLFGWVQSARDQGGAIFVDLRDREGIAQVVFDREHDAEGHKLAEQLRREWVIGIAGVVRDRGAMRNPRLATGAIEVLVTSATVFNRSETPPFEIEDDTDTGEEKRLEYRYLDLRRPKMQKIFLTRHRINQVTRSVLDSEGFLEIETPSLIKYTPGGARNFLVPSRSYAGKFYALAESPQLFKQLFMVAGFDRYFQLARCWRDEDLRVDRQPEFMQIDVEMSFCTQDDVFGVVEKLVFRIWKDVLGVDLLARFPSGHFPRVPFAESMRRFGNDKPDMRYGMEHVDLTELMIEHGGGGIPMLAEISERFARGDDRRDLPSHIFKAMVVPGTAGPEGKGLSRTETDKLEEFVKSMGAKGLARAKVAEDGTWTQSPFAKTITPEFRTAVNAATGAKAGDVILFQFGRQAQVQTVMANLRSHVARKLGLVPEFGTLKDDYNFLWVVDPPLFEYDDDSRSWSAAHHAFTRPHDACVPLLETDPGNVLCHRYDLVLNGFEIAGGSIRLHDPDVQRRVFNALGISDDEARAKFGFLLDALKFGAPPHGGIAVGLDRLVMLLTGAESLREVVAYPKTQKGVDLLTGAPGTVSPEQLTELRIAVVKAP